MVEIREYRPSDLIDIKTWFRLHSRPLDETLMPSIGFIAPGIAAGFLVRTDCGFCFLEPFISNPKSTYVERNDALSLILDKLVETSRLLNFKYAIGVSTSKSMISRALGKGFHIQDISTVVVKGN